MSIAAPLSVLQLRSSAGLYGADRMVLTLNQALAEHGARSRLLNINNYRLGEQALHDAARHLGQNAHLLPCRGRFDPRTVDALANEIESAGAEVVHVHDYKSAFYAWLANRRRRPALVATLHGWVENSKSLRLYTRLELALLRRFDALAVVAAEQAERLVRAGIAPSRIHHVDNAIPANAYPAAPSDAVRNALGLPHDGFVFGAVARLAPEKNLSMLIDAFGSVASDDPACSLLVVGDGPERAMLETRAQARGLQQRIRFAGMRSDMDQVYPLIDCLVLPSLSEGMPLVVLEAMSSAIPIIASAVGDVPRLLSQSAHGQTVTPGDLASLCDAMRTMASAPGRRDLRARAYVLEHHSPAAMARNYLDLYRSLSSDGHGRKSA